MKANLHYGWASAPYMKLPSKILRGFAYVWVRLVVLAVIAGTVSIWITEGFGAVQDM